MYRVINTISYRNSWTHRYPEFAKRGEGLMVLLDPSQITEPPDVQGRTIKIHKPDGQVTQLVAIDSEVHHSVVGLFFSGITEEEIPLGAQLEW